MANNWKLTLKKGLSVAAIGGLTALGTWFATADPKIVGGAVVVTVVGSIIQAALNALKHSDLTADGYEKIATLLAKP